VRTYLVSESRIITADPQQVFNRLTDPTVCPVAGGSSAVVERDEPRLIAWCSRGGQVWRFLLEPVPDGTRVTQQWDVRRTRGRSLLIAGRQDVRNRRAIRAALQQLSELASPEPPPHQPHSPRPILNITTRPTDG
jgi:hypothetical protein